MDPGETADILISTTNIGGYLAQNTIGTLLCSNPLITINNATHSLDTLAIGETDYAVFNVTVSPAAPMDSLIVLNYIANSGAYSAQKSFNAIIGLIFDGFETGNSNQFHGYRAESTHGPSATSILLKEPIVHVAEYWQQPFEPTRRYPITWVVTTSISFFEGFSQLPTRLLGFYIDNVQKGQGWSGEKAWEREVFLYSRCSYL